MKKLIGIALVLALMGALAACGGGSSDSGEPATKEQLIGTWHRSASLARIMFYADNRFEYDNGSDSIIDTFGTYSVASNKSLTLTDSGGANACFTGTGLVIIGTYETVLDERNLSFRALSDQCEGRRAILTSSDWIKQ